MLRPQAIAVESLAVWGTANPRSLARGYGRRFGRSRRGLDGTIVADTARDRKRRARRVGTPPIMQMPGVCRPAALDDCQVARLSENSRGPTTSCTSMTRSRFCAGPFRSRDLRFGRLPRSWEVPPKRRCHFRTTARNSPTASRQSDRVGPPTRIRSCAARPRQARSDSQTSLEERVLRQDGLPTCLNVLDHGSRCSQR